MIINDNGTERKATADEITYYAAWQADVENTTQAQAQAEADRLAIKTATIAKLGLTADEVAALLS